MARMYLKLWNRIAANEEVSITCHKDKAIVIRRALYKEKSRIKLVKDATDQPSFGRLSIKETTLADDRVRLFITLSYNGANL